MILLSQLTVSKIIKYRDTAMKRIKKAEIKAILDAYSIRPDEFVRISEESFAYKSRFAKGYHITIQLDPDGRILASHTNRNGRRTHIDVWERTENGLEWLYRNTPNIPLSDRAAIEGMQREIEELKSAGRKLQEQIKENMSSSEECQKLSKNVGRPKETDRINKIVREIEILLQQGYRDIQIMEKLQITKPTFYRYKRKCNRSVMDSE